MRVPLPDPRVGPPPDSGTSTSAPAGAVGVRSATAADATDIGRLQAEVWASSYAGDLPRPVLESCTAESFAASWDQALTTDPPGPGRAVLLAYDEGRTVGLLVLEPTDDPDSVGTAEIVELAVHPTVRRRGHGSRMLAAAVDLLRDGGASRMQTWVLVRHEETRAFFQGAGFAVDGARRERVVDEDHTLLEARLVTVLEMPAEDVPPIS